jgi:hypothetical protein
MAPGFFGWLLISLERSFTFMERVEWLMRTARDLSKGGFEGEF